MSESAASANVAFAWFEKFALMLLAAHLESEGYRALLSVPVAEALTPQTQAGIDWACALAVVSELGRPCESTADRTLHRLAKLTQARRESLRKELPARLGELLARDKTYRYSGIWNDTPRAIDLAAWKPGLAPLHVEAKGIVLRRGEINWPATLEKGKEIVQHRKKVPWTAGDGVRRGVLFPDDRRIVEALPGWWPKDRPQNESNPVFLIAAGGRIRETTVATLSATRH